MVRFGAALFPHPPRSEGKENYSTLVLILFIAGSQGSTAERSHHLFATAVFKWGVAGVGQIGIGNFHMHRDLAGRSPSSPNLKAWCRQFGAGLRACGSRVVCGDANKAIFILAGLLRDECGLLVEMVAHHSELAINEPVDMLCSRGLRSALRRDTMGIWMVGGVMWVRSLTLDSQCLAGAMHPAFLERDSGRFKCFQRGFATSTFALPSGDDSPECLRAREVPYEIACRQVARLWQAHDLRPVGQCSQARQFQWRMDPAAAAADEWVQVATALPKPGEEWQALWSTCSNSSSDTTQ